MVKVVCTFNIYIKFSTYCIFKAILHNKGKYEKLKVKDYFLIIKAI
jgi:hypothetical protein